MTATITLQVCLIIVQAAAMPTFSPGARNGHRMAALESQQQIVLFGGVDSARNFLAETWVFQNDRWRRYEGRAPAARAWHTMTYDPAARNVVLYGGRGPRGTRYEDTWLWDGRQWKEAVGTGPGPRDHHGAAYDSAGGTLLLYGGFDGARVLDDLWEYRDGTWQRLHWSGPPARAAHGMARARGGVVISGGLQLPDSLLSDTWILRRGRWYRAQTLPAPISHFSMEWSGSCQCNLVFGGKDQDRAPLGQLQAFNGEAWRTLSVRAPAPRIDFASAVFQNRLFVHGGKTPDPGPQFGDFWTFDGTAWDRLDAPVSRSFSPARR